MTEPEICAFCLQPGSLCDSHIVPELAYRPVYDASRSAIAIDVHQGRADIRQKGFSERLLCEACEKRMNKWETYFSRVWLHAKSSLRPKSLSLNEDVRISGLKYPQFKLFHMSVLWRMGVSRLEAFKCVRLGAREDTLRSMLLAEDPGLPTDFGLAGFALRNEHTGGWHDGLWHSPQQSRVHGQWVYTVIFGGTRWYYFASRHVSNRLLREQSLSEEGELELGVQNWTDDLYLRRDVPRIRQIPLPRRRG